MKTSILRDWLFPIAVLVTWAVGFSYSLVRIGEAYRTHPATAMLASAK